MASIQLSDLSTSSLHPFAEGARKQQRTESHEPFEPMPTERRTSQLAKNSRWKLKGRVFDGGKGSFVNGGSPLFRWQGRWRRPILASRGNARMATPHSGHTCGFEGVSMRKRATICMRFRLKDVPPEPISFLRSGRKRGDFLIVFNQGGAAVDILCWNYRTLLYQQLQGLLTLFSEFFSSFPCGTCTLSISHCVFSLGRSIPPD